MTDLARMIATAVIWGALTVMFVAMAVTQNEINFLIVGILAGVGWFATDAVWDGARVKSSDRAKQEQAEKAKRRTRLDAMVDDLSQDELRELRSRLMDDSDGEMVSMDDLLREQRRDSR
jgi:uncharacterized membrane protein